MMTINVITKLVFKLKLAIIFIYNLCNFVTISSILDSSISLSFQWLQGNYQKSS